MNTNPIFTLPSKLLIFIIDHAERFFFFLSLNPFFIVATYQRFPTGPAQARKQYVSKTCFSFKIKDRIIFDRIIFELEGILKNNLRLFKLVSKALLVYHCATMSTKWGNNFDPFRRYFSKNYLEKYST